MYTADVRAFSELFVARARARVCVCVCVCVCRYIYVYIYTAPEMPEISGQRDRFSPKQVLSCIHILILFVSTTNNELLQRERER